MSALSNIFTTIANSIRSKLGGSSRYKPSQMAERISNINNNRYILWYANKPRGVSNTELNIFIMNESQYRTLQSLGNTPTVVYCVGGFTYSCGVSMYDEIAITRSIHNAEIRNQRFAKRDGAFYAVNYGTWQDEYVQLSVEKVCLYS